MNAILGRLGSSDFLSLNAEGELNDLPRFVRRQYLGIFTFGRISIQPDRLAISMMPAEWAAHHRDDVLFGLGAVQGKEGYLLTAPSKALQTMVLAHGGDEGAFSEALVLVRPVQKGGSCYSEK